MKAFGSNETGLLRCALCAALAGMGLFATAADGQVASALIREADDLGAEGVVDSISNSAVNHAFGYAFTLNTSNGITTLSRVWGNPAGGLGFMMRTEGTVGIFEQLSFESFFGISNAGGVAYSPSCTNTVSGSTGLDSVWLDDAFFCMEEELYPNDPNFWWSFGSRPGVTADGNAYWVGGITGTQGGTTANRGLFYGPTATALLLGGDTVPNLPDVLDTASTVSFDVRFSAFGTNYIAEAQVDNLLSTANNAIVISGSGLMLDGGLVIEGSPIPASVGGLPDENWDNFDYAGITESGEYMFTGDSDGDIATDEFILKNGQILHREGDALGGEVLSGSIEGAYMNEQGDIAFIWDVQANTLEALYLNHELLLKEGDPVDWDGDGNVDANAILTDFTGISALTMSDRGPSNEVTLYFTADIAVDAVTLEGAFALAYVVPPPPCPWDCEEEPDGMVGIDDLVAVINHWGACPAPPAECPWDCEDEPDGNVGIDDLVAVINHWGACPQ